MKRNERQITYHCVVQGSLQPDPCNEKPSFIVAFERLAKPVEMVGDVPLYLLRDDERELIGVGQSLGLSEFLSNWLGDDEDGGVYIADIARVGIRIRVGVGLQTRGWGTGV